MNKHLSMVLVPCGIYLLLGDSSSLCSVSKAASEMTQAGHVTVAADRDTQSKKTVKHGDNRASSAVMVYVIQKGDTLYSVAAKTTGSNRNWKHIAKYNHISDPSKVRAGQKITIPVGLVSAAEKKDSGQSSHSPQAGAMTPLQPEKHRASHDTREQSPRLSDVPALTMKNAEAPTPVVKPETGWIVIKGGYYPREINRKADPASDVLIQVWPGTRIRYFQRKDGWYKVNTRKGVGYVNPGVVRRE